MKEDKIVTMDAKLFPQMETKWFKVTFSPDEPNVHNKMFAFASYVEDRNVLNTDLHFIEYFVTADFGKISYERLLKTNSATYLRELMQDYNLKETAKPDNVGSVN